MRLGRLAKWQPKKWEAMHEQIVLLSTLGRSNVQIAQMFGYTPQHICNILNTPEASLIRRRVLENLRESVKSSMDQKMDDLADQSVHRLTELMYDDDLYSKSPFQVVDRGLAILRGVGKMKSGDAPGTGPIKNAIIMSSEDAKMLKEGAERAIEARKLNAPKEIEVEPAAAD